MDARRWKAFGTIFWLVAFAGWARAESVPTGQVIPLAVRDGRCECVLPTEHPDDKYYLIVGSLARDLSPRRVTIHTTATDDPVSVAREKPPADDGWERRTWDLRNRLDQIRREQPAPRAYRAAADPPKERTFYLFVKEKDFLNPDSYATVTADLRAVGKHCLVYVDHDQVDPDGLRPTIKNAVAAYDDEVYPQACERLGHALDVDRDGRFTILFTGWLNKLGGGKIKLDGFVRGSDFYRDLDAPYGNRCDMMYLNPELKPGAYLRTLLAHEYSHAVVFSEHVFGDYLPDAPRADEEGWLNEGLAHLNEDAHGYSWRNLDYRVSTFLSAPNRYSLIVPDYYNAGLFRSHGHRGATYLFLRWCADRDAELVRRLVQTNQAGVTNLETATCRRFGELFRSWNVALLLSGSGLDPDGSPPFQHFDLRKPLADRLLCGPRLNELALDAGNQETNLAGTSAGYFLLHSPGGKRTRVTVTAEAGTELQVTLVRLPRSMARLSLRWEDGHLLVSAHDGAVNLNAAAWERLSPTTHLSEDTSYRSKTPARTTVREWFGDGELKPGEERRGADIVLPKAEQVTDAIIFKVSGTDALGRRVAAWVEAPVSR
jgi:hypothetical protein